MQRKWGIAMKYTRRTCGMTLVEVTVALAVVLIFFGGVTAAMLSETRAVDNSVRLLLAKAEADRAVVAMLEDLQTTNTVETDDSGNPYITVLGDAEGPGPKLRFQRVEGFQISGDADSVVALYGAPITYRINENDQLVREQNGASRVIANNVSALGFTITPEGTIVIDLETYSGSGTERVKVANSLSVTPRNGYDR